jgi:diacylglycerol kinase (ATP)
MHEILRRHQISFINAFAGVKWALTTQPNFRIHFTLSLLAVFGGIIFQINQVEMLVIVFTIILGLTGEMINTSIEAMTDLISTEWHEKAKIAKDVAAGMMLTIAFGAIGVALIIFLHHFISLFK